MKHILMTVIAAILVTSCIHSTERVVNPEYQTLEISMLEFCEDKETEKPYFVGPAEYNQLEMLISQANDSLKIWIQASAQFAPGEGVMVICPGPYKGEAVYKIKWN